MSNRIDRTAGLCLPVIAFLLCCLAVSVMAQGQQQQQEEELNNTPTTSTRTATSRNNNDRRRERQQRRLRRFEAMHHVVRTLVSARVNPETGKPCSLSSHLEGTPVEQAEGIYTALGRTRASKRNNKLRFSMRSLITSRLSEPENGEGSQTYQAPNIFHAEIRVFKHPSVLPTRQQRLAQFANLSVTSPTGHGHIGRTRVSLRGNNRWETINVTEFMRTSLATPTRAVEFAFHARALERGGTNRKLTVSQLLSLSGDQNNTQRPVLILYLREPVDPLQYILVKVQEARDAVESRKRRETSTGGPNDVEVPARSTEPTVSGTPVPAENSTHHNLLQLIAPRENECRLHSMYLDFSSIGWNHIIAPEGFDPRSCRGNCYDPLTSSTNHAIVRSWAFRNNHPELADSPVPTVCCIPTQFSSMTLVIQEEQGDILKSDLYYDMRAEACGCR